MAQAMKLFSFFHHGVFCKKYKICSQCFYRVIETRVEVWEHEKHCGNTSRWRVFPQLFRVLLNFDECFYNSIEPRYMFSIS